MHEIEIGVIEVYIDKLKIHVFQIFKIRKIHTPMMMISKYPNTIQHDPNDDDVQISKHNSIRFQ